MVRLKREDVELLLSRMKEEDVKEIQIDDSNGRVKYDAVETIWRTRPFQLRKRQKRASAVS